MSVSTVIIKLFGRGVGLRTRSPADAGVVYALTLGLSQAATVCVGHAVVAVNLRGWVNPVGQRQSSDWLLFVGSSFIVLCLHLLTSHPCHPSSMARPGNE